MNSIKVEADSMGRENEEIATEMNLSGQLLPCWSRAEGQQCRNRGEQYNI